LQITFYIASKTLPKIDLWEIKMQKTFIFFIPS